jgi:ribonuclease J
VEGVAKITGAVECGYVYVDGASVGEITEVDLKDRRILGEEGFISIVVVVDSGTGKIVAGPDVHARGFAEDESVFDELRPRITDALAAAAGDGVGDTHQLQQVIRRVVGRWVNESYRRRPMILPLVVEA